MARFPLAVPFVLTATLAGCPVDEDLPPDPDPPHEYPLDDVLRFDDLQALGTHNSYHLETGETPVTAWDYSHRPLDEQLGLLGVRQFELDIFRDWETDSFWVFHVPFLDMSTTCLYLDECLGAMKEWSDRNPGHHPLFTLMELKDDHDPETVEEYLLDLEDEVLAIWPEDRLVTPDLVRGDHESLSAALAAEGWPALGELRGRALFVLHDGGGYRELYTQGGTGGRALFPDALGDLSLPFAAVHSINDPTASIDAIHAAVDAGHLVRTRADYDSTQAWASDTTYSEAALASGAHFVSTDYPEPHYESGYVVVIPGGTPSRCNPRSAPEECFSEAIEDPQVISP